MSTPAPNSSGGGITDAERLCVFPGRANGLDARGKSYLARYVEAIPIRQVCARLRSAAPHFAFESSVSRPSTASVPMHQTSPNVSPEFDAMVAARSAYGVTAGAELLGAIEADRLSLKAWLEAKAKALAVQMLGQRREIVRTFSAKYANERSIMELAQALTVVIAARQHIAVPMTIEQDLALPQSKLETLLNEFPTDYVPPALNPRTQSDIYQNLIEVSAGRIDRPKNRVDEYNHYMGAARTSAKMDGRYLNWNLDSQPFANRGEVLALLFGAQTTAQRRQALLSHHPIVAILPNYENQRFELADIVRMTDIKQRNNQLRKKIEALTHDLDRANNAFQQDIAASRKGVGIDWAKYRPLIETAALELYHPGDPRADPLRAVVQSIANDLKPFDPLEFGQNALMAIAIVTMVLSLQVEFLVLPFLLDVTALGLSGWRFWEAVETAPRDMSEQQFLEVDKRLFVPLEEGPSINEATLDLFLASLFVAGGIKSIRLPAKPKATPGADLSGRLALIPDNAIGRVSNVKTEVGGLAQVDDIAKGTTSARPIDRATKAADQGKARPVAQTENPATLEKGVVTADLTDETKHMEELFGFREQYPLVLNKPDSGKATDFVKVVVSKQVITSPQGEQVVVRGILQPNIMDADRSLPPSADPAKYEVAVVAPDGTLAATQTDDGLPYVTIARLRQLLNRPSIRSAEDVLVGEVFDLEDRGLLSHRQVRSYLRGKSTAARNKIIQSYKDRPVIGVKRGNVPIKSGEQTWPAPEAVARDGKRVHVGHFGTSFSEMLDYAKWDPVYRAMTVAQYRQMHWSSAVLEDAKLNVKKGKGKDQNEQPY